MFLVVALAIGLACGFAVGRSRRAGASTTPALADTGGADHGGRDSLEVSLAEAAEQLDIGLVVAAPSGKLVYRNSAASVLAGTHGGVILDDRLDRAFAAARAGQRVTTVVELHGPPRLVLSLAVEPMSSGAVVATIQDISERARIDEVRTDFVANVSHELKTPVGAIAVLAEALIDEPDPAVVRRAAVRMVDEAHRAVRTIDDLLELSQIESANHDDDVVELTGIVRAAIARGRVADRGRGVRVESFDAGAPIRLRADRRQLVSALGNLVENAVKYSDDDGSVQVRTRIDDRFVEVMVADHGVGIPERDLDRIFERFYRVDRARSRQTGGTGLGLAIVSHVAANHGGEVQVSSQEGEGSTFAFRLPASLIVRDALDAPAVHHEEPAR